LKKIGRFLFWCSGAPYELIWACPQSEKHKYQKLGLTVLVPTIFAFLSGYYALTTIIDKDGILSNSEFALITILSLFWAFAIFCIDVYILATYRKINRGNKWGTVAQVGIRIILSVFLGIVISYPLVLKILEDPISIKAFQIRREQIQKFEKSRNDEVAQRVLNEIELHDKSKRSVDTFKQVLALKLVDEVQGNGSKTIEGKPNPYYGRIAKTIDTLQRRSENEANALESSFSQRKRYLQDTLQKEIERRWDSLINDFKNKPYNDILAKSKALSRLQKDDKEENDNTTKLVHWFILIAFILLDCTAILLKMLTKAGPLDYLLEQEDIKYRSEQTVYKDVYEGLGYQNSYSQYLTMKLGLENEVKLSKEILTKTQEHFQYIMNERQKFQDTVSDLLNEYRRETDYLRREELNRLIKSLTETFLNSIEKANQKFSDTINSK
jgi:hypothetical protein